MSESDIDNLLNDLGVPGSPSGEPAEAPSPSKSPAPPASTVTTSDEKPPLAASEAPPSTRHHPRSVPIDLDDEALNILWIPETPSESRGGSDDVLAQRLLDVGAVDPSQLQSAQTILQKTPGKTLRDVLMEMGVDEESIQKIIAEMNQLPFEPVDAESGVHLATLKRLGLDYCKRNQILPLRREGKSIVIGTARPDDVFLLDEIRRHLSGMPVRHVLITSNDISVALEAQEDDEDEGETFAMDELLADIDEGDVEVVESKKDDVDFAKQAGESPVIRYVNYIIQNAMKEGASDIHIEPGEKKLKVRFRIDGILFEMMNPPHKMHAAIVSRLKIMANLDISERRLPQDGRIRAVVGGRKLDLRVSTLPTAQGEKCVIRILDDRTISVGLNQLGFDETMLSIWLRQIEQPHGIILVTGPTGSGKTTTLYSSLREMDTRKLNVSTVEDPVEYHMDGVAQVQIHDKIGMTFAAALRSLLRQDPDVVMVGEIRDGETSRIAIQAALTGHLVLSTLHTNDAPSSVTRLINIGVEPFLIGAALNAVLAQRLVRRICPNCVVTEAPSEEIAEFLSLQGLNSDTISRGVGCDKCRQTGYVGRLGLYELLVLDDVTRDAIARNPNVTEFRRMCVERGMVTLRQDGMQKVVAGSTTVHEILRVTEATI